MHRLAAASLIAIFVACGSDADDTGVNGSYAVTWDAASAPHEIDTAELADIAPDEAHPGITNTLTLSESAAGNFEIFLCTLTAESRLSCESFAGEATVILTGSMDGFAGEYRATPVDAAFAMHLTR